MKRKLFIVVMYLFSTLCLSVVAYCLIALVVSTDTERALIRENRMYAEMYAELKEKTERIADVTAAVQHRDEMIYREIFCSEAPDFDPDIDVGGTFGSDTTAEYQMVHYSDRKSRELCAGADSIEACFLAAFEYLSVRDAVIPPMLMPVEGVSYSQFGASVGVKMHPSYRFRIQHNGVDFLVPQGTGVVAAADGIVSEVRHSLKGEGNVVIIRHRGGYVTKYAHLGSISVRNSAFVHQGESVGTVGVTGMTLAPHLHYEVTRDGKVLNPVNYMFASLGPEDYTGAMYVSSNTEQSMD